VQFNSNNGGSTIFIRISNLKWNLGKNTNTIPTMNPPLRAFSQIHYTINIQRAPRKTELQQELFVERISYPPKPIPTPNTVMAQRPPLKDDSRRYIVGQIQDRNGKISYTTLD